VIRRRLFDSYRFDSTSRNEGEDQLIVVHAIKAGCRLGYFDDIHLIYNIHDANSSNSSSSGPLTKQLRVLRLLAEGYEALQERVTLTASERRALQRRLAREYFWHIGYFLLWKNGRQPEALDFFRRGLRHWPWSYWMWKTYFWSQVRTICSPP
jgi:hypothetical protein